MIVGCGWYGLNAHETMEYVIAEICRDISSQVYIDNSPLAQRAIFRMLKVSVGRLCIVSSSHTDTLLTLHEAATIGNEQSIFRRASFVRRHFATCNCRIQKHHCCVGLVRRHEQRAEV